MTPRTWPVDHVPGLATDLDRLPFGCARCPARWGGYRTAHCGACHCTFTGVKGFDLHRRGGECADPKEIGMVTSTTRQYTAWRSANEGDE